MLITKRPERGREVSYHEYETMGQELQRIISYYDLYQPKLHYTFEDVNKLEKNFYLVSSFCLKLLDNLKQCQRNCSKEIITAHVNNSIGMNISLTTFILSIIGGIVISITSPIILIIPFIVLGLFSVYSYHSFKKELSK